MLRNREFDAAEMSLSSYCVSLMRDEPDFIAIPAFPFALFPALVHFCVSEERHSRAEGARRQENRRAGIPDDRAGMDPRHSAGRVRRRTRGLRVLDGRRGGARP